VRSILVAAAFAVAATAGTPAQDTPVYPAGKGITSPVLVKETKPQYTEGAMRRKVEGVVELKAVVLKNGTVREDVTVVRSLDSELDEQAIAAARLWEFRPGTKDGEPVNVQVNIEMSFSLRKR
jgi:periplasmic protein TonB